MGVIARDRSLRHAGAEPPPVLVRSYVGCVGVIAGQEVRRAVRGTDGWIEAAGRAGLVAHGIVYALVGALAVRAAFGTGRGHMGRKESLAAMAVVGLVGIAVLAPLSSLGRLRRATFMSKLDTSGMSSTERRLIERLGRIGHGARGVVFSNIGLFLLPAAFRSSPRQARGLGGALEALAALPHGPFLLALVVVGLLSYALFAVAQARYRRIAHI
jgi:hypothetical protein